jgi:hypothetical protein
VCCTPHIRAGPGGAQLAVAAGADIRHLVSSSSC